ncbi:MAG: hypothetical protein WBA57_09645 [Elainellaceae cyanobacterium]
MVSIPNRISLLDRFQGILLGSHLAMGNAHQNAMWLQVILAIAQRLGLTSAANVSMLSSPTDASDEVKLTNSWEQGLQALPVVLAHFDQLHDWRCYEVIVANVQDVGGDYFADSGDRQNQLSQDSLTANVMLCGLPYALVPCALATILSSGLHSRQACQLLIEALDKGLQTEPSPLADGSTLLLCHQLLHCVKDAVDSSQGLDTFLRKVRHVVDQTKASTDPVATDPVAADPVAADPAQIAADGVLVAILLYCLMSTPEDYDVTIRRFQRILDCQEMSRFEELQPYLQRSQPSAIATLGGLLGAVGGQSSLPLSFVHTHVRTMITASESKEGQTPYRDVPSKIYTELMDLGMRLWGLWSGIDPSLCRQLNMVDGAAQGSSSEIMANIGVTASPNLIRVFDR